jgi:hypothetical protein
MGDDVGWLVTASRIFGSHLDHWLALGILIARLADILSTRFATPNLRLEMNPLVRKLGWPFGWASLLLCLLPYAAEWGSAAAVPIIVMSLFVAGSNVGRAWAMRTLGEDAYLAFMREAFARARPRLVYGSIAVSSALIASAGGLLLLFYPEPGEWAYYFAQGIVFYGVALALHSSLHARRMFRELQAR